MKLPSISFKNAGTTYNTGNYAMLAGDILEVLAEAQFDPQKATIGLAKKFVGKIPVVETTLASLMFFIGGDKYDEAWATGFPPDARKNMWGHLFSAAGAALLGSGMTVLSADNPVALASAVIGGTLHTVGKLGSVLAPKHDAFFKALPLLSRAPAVAAATYDVCANFSQSGSKTEAIIKSILPLVTIACGVVWARADVMLMPEGRTKSVLSKALLIPKAP